MNDHPPTPSLVAMRKKHTRQSVAYNMGHFQDHVKDTHTSIQKMASVDPKGAKAHQAKIINSLNGLVKQTKKLPVKSAVPGLAGYLKSKG